MPWPNLSGKTPDTEYHCIAIDPQTMGAGLENDQAKLSLWNTWWLEGLCCVLAVVALIAIVGTVYQFRNKPLPQWPHELSMNTLISIYTVAMKAAMAFVLAQGTYVETIFATKHKN